MGVRNQRPSGLGGGSSSFAMQFAQQELQKSRVIGSRDVDARALCKRIFLIYAKDAAWSNEDTFPCPLMRKFYVIHTGRQHKIEVVACDRVAEDLSTDPFYRRFRFLSRLFDALHQPFQMSVIMSFSEDGVHDALYKSGAVD